MDQKRPFLTSVGQALFNSTQERFHREVGPDGTPWPKLKPKTIKARIKGGSSQIAMLRETRGLYGSLNVRTSEDEVRLGTAHDLASVHQFGATIRMPERDGHVYRMRSANGEAGCRFAQKEKANHITKVRIPARETVIPARPFVGLSAEDEAKILEEATDWLTR